MKEWEGSFMTSSPRKVRAGIASGFLCGVIGLFSPTAGLSDDTGFYGGITGQAVSIEKIGHGGSAGLGGLPGLIITTEYDLGYGVLASLGYDFPGGFRAELEGGYRRSEVDHVVISSDGGLGNAIGVGSLDGLSIEGNGNAEALSGMVNVYYDHDMGGGFAPYLMGGAGFARISNKMAIFGTILVDDHDVVPAWQFGLGAGYALTDRVTVSGGYRYFAATETEIQDAAGNAINGEYVSHSFEFGIRVSF